MGIELGGWVDNMIHCGRDNEPDSLRCLLGWHKWEVVFPKLMRKCQRCAKEQVFSHPLGGKPRWVDVLECDCDEEDCPKCLESIEKWEREHRGVIGTIPKGDVR